MNFLILFFHPVVPVLLAPPYLWTDEKGLTLCLPTRATTTTVSRRGMWPYNPMLFDLMWTPGLPVGLSGLIPSCSIYPRRPHPPGFHIACTLCYCSLPLLIWPNFLFFPNLPNCSPGHLEFMGYHGKPSRSPAAALNVLITCLSWLKPGCLLCTSPPLQSAPVEAAYYQCSSIIIIIIHSSNTMGPGD